MASKFQWPGGYSGRAFDPMAIKPQDVFWFLDLETNWIPEQQGPGWREGQVPFSFSLQPFGIRGGKWTHLQGGKSGRFNVAGAGHDPASLLSEQSDVAGVTQSLSHFLGDAKPEHFSGRGTWNYETFSKHLEENILGSGGRIILGGQNLGYDIPIIDQMMRDSGLDPIIGRSNVYMADTVTLAQQIKNRVSQGSKLPQLTAEFGHLMPANIMGQSHQARYDTLAAGYVWGGMTQTMAQQRGVAIPGINAPWHDPAATQTANISAQARVSAQHQYNLQQRRSPSMDDAMLSSHGVQGLLGNAQTLYGSTYLSQNPALGNRFSGNEWRVDTEMVEGNMRVNILRQLRGGSAQSLTFDVRGGPQTEFGQSFQLMTPTGAGYFIGSSVHVGVTPGQEYGKFESTLSHRTPTQNLTQLIMGSFHMADLNRSQNQGYTVEQAMGEIIQGGMRLPGSSPQDDQWLIKPGALMGLPGEHETTINRFAAQMPFYLQSTNIGERLNFATRRDATSQFTSSLQTVGGTYALGQQVNTALRQGGYFINEEGRLEKGAEAYRSQIMNRPGRVGFEHVDQLFMMRSPDKFIKSSSVYGRRFPVQPVAYDEQAGRYGFAGPDVDAGGQEIFKTRRDRSPIYGRVNALYPGETQATNEFFATTLYAETGIPGGGIAFGNRYNRYQSFGVERTKAKMFTDEQLSLDQVMTGGGIDFRRDFFGQRIEGGVGRVAAGYAFPHEGGKFDPSAFEIDIGESSFIPQSGEMVIPRYARRTSSGAWQPVRTRGVGLSGDDDIIDMTEYEETLSKRMGMPVRATGITQVGWKISGIQEVASKWGGSGVKAGMSLSTKDRFLAGSASGGIDYMTGEMKQPAMRMWDSFAAMSPYQQHGILEEWSTRLASSQGRGDPRAFMKAVRSEYPWNSRDALNPITGEKAPPIMDPTRLAQMGSETGVLGQGAIGWEIFGSMFGTLFGKSPTSSAEWTKQTEYLRKFGVGWRNVGDVPLPEHSQSSLSYLTQTFRREFRALQGEGAVAPHISSWNQAFKEMFDVSPKLARDASGNMVSRGSLGLSPLFNVTRKNVTGLQMAGLAPWEAEYAGGMKLNFEALYALSAKYPEVAQRVGANVGFTDSVSQAWGEMYQWTTFQTGAQSGGSYAVPEKGQYLPINKKQIENIQTDMMKVDRTLQDPEKVKQLQQIIAGTLGTDAGDRRMLYAKELDTFIPSANAALDLEYEEHGIAIGRQSTMLWNAWKRLGNAAMDEGTLPVGFPEEDILAQQRIGAQQSMGTMHKYYTKIFNAGEEAMKRVSGQQNFGLGGIGGRYSANPGLEINEAFIGKTDLDRLLSSAGVPKREWGAARNQLANEGYIPSVMWRYPQLSIDAGYRGMKILTEEHMAKQQRTFNAEPRVVRGKNISGDPAARNVMQVSPWFAELMSGDFDYDPYAMLSLIRHGDDKPLEIIKDPQVQAEIEQNFTGILKDTEAYLKAMFPDPKIRRQTSALQDSLKNMLGESGMLMTDGGKLSSPDQIVKAYESFGFSEKHFNELSIAAEEYQINKMGMGRSYNMRRMIEAAGAVEGRGNKALRAGWEAAAQIYQPHLDLYFGASSGLESAASAFFRFNKADPAAGIERSVKDISFYHRDQRYSMGLRDFQSRRGMKMLADVVLSPEDMGKGLTDVDPVGNTLFSYLFSRDDAEFLRLNKLMENVKGADRAQIYKDYLDEQPDNTDYTSSPLIRSMVTTGAKKQSGGDRALVEQYIAATRGDEYLQRVLATETVYNLSAASKTGATPAVRFGQTLEVLQDQPGLNLYGTHATAVLKRIAGGKQTMANVPPGNIPPDVPTITAGGYAQLPGDEPPPWLEAMFKRVVNVAGAGSVYKSPINAELGSQLHRQAGSLGTYTKNLTNMYQMLPSMLEGAYGSAFSGLSSKDAIARFVEGMTSGGTPEFDLRKLVADNPEMAGMLKRLGPSVKAARRSMRSEVTANVEGGDTAKAAFQRMLLPLAGYENVNANPLQLEAVAGMQGMLSQIPASEFTKAMPRLSPMNTNLLEAIGAQEMADASLVALSTQRPGGASYQGRAHKREMALARATSQHAMAQQNRIKIGNKIAADMGVDPGMIPASASGVAAMPNAHMIEGDKLPSYTNAMTSEMTKFARMEELAAGTEPIGRTATANLKEVTRLLDDVSKATKNYTDVLSDHKSSVGDIAKANEDYMVAQAKAATGGRAARIGTSLDMQMGRGGDRSALMNAARGRIAELTGMDNLSGEQAAQLEDLTTQVGGMEEDERRLANARRAQAQGAKGRRPWARAGGFARRLFGGFGMMYLGTVGRMAWGGARLGYEESVQAEAAATSAIGGAIGGAPVDSVESAYQTAMGLYGGFGQRGLKNLQTQMMNEQPGVYSQIMSGVGALSAGGASMWIAGLAGVTGPAAPVIGATVATAAYGVSQYANYEGALAEPTQLGVTGAARGFGDSGEFVGPLGFFQRKALDLGGVSAWLLTGGNTEKMAYYQSPEAQETRGLIGKLEAYEEAAASGNQPMDQRALLAREGISDRSKQAEVMAAYAQYKGTKFAGIPEAGRLAASAFQARYNIALGDTKYAQLSTMIGQNVPIVGTATAMAQAGGVSSERTGGLVMSMLAAEYDTADIERGGRGAQFFASLDSPWASMEGYSDADLLEEYDQYGDMRPRGKAMFAAKLRLAESRAMLGRNFVMPDPSNFMGQTLDSQFRSTMQEVGREQAALNPQMAMQQILTNADLPQTFIDDRVSGMDGRPILENTFAVQQASAVDSYVSNLMSGWTGASPRMGQYLTTRFQANPEILSPSQWRTATGAAAGNQQAMGQLWGMQFSGQIPANNMGLNMLDMGYMMNTDINQFGGMRGIPSIRPLFSNSMNWGGMNAEGVATEFWGQGWESGGPTMPAAPGAQHTSMRQAMVRGIALPGATDIFGGQMMLGGKNAVSYMQSNLQYEQAMASAGLALEGIALQQAFQTGVGIDKYAGTVNPQTGQPFGFNTGRFSWNVPGVGSGKSTGGGLWGVQDAMRSLNYAQQGYAFERQGEQLEMTSQFFYQNIGLSQQQASMQRRWAQEDWGFQDQQRQMNWAWQQEDFAESSRFLTGRDRRLAERQMQRATISYGMEGEQIDKGRERQKEMWALEDQRFDIQKTQHEEQKQFQQESIETNRKFFEERKKLEEEMQKMQRAFQVEQWELAKKQAATSAYYAQKSKEVQDAMLEIAEKEAQITDLQAAAIAGNEEALIKLADFWQVTIAEAIAAINRIKGLGGGGGGGGGGPTPSVDRYANYEDYGEDWGSDNPYADQEEERKKEEENGGTGGLSATLSSRTNYNPWDDAIVVTPNSNQPTTNNFAIYIGEEEIKEYIVRAVNESLEVS